MQSEIITAGALVRRDVRALLDAEGVEWREHKGWIDSTFVVFGTARQIRHLRPRLRYLFGEG